MNFQIQQGGTGILSVKWFAEDGTEIPDPGATFVSGDAATIGLVPIDAASATVSGVGLGTSVPVTVTSSNGVVATQEDGSAVTFDIVAALKQIVRGVVSFVANAAALRT